MLVFLPENNLVLFYLKWGIEKNLSAVALLALFDFQGKVRAFSLHFIYFTTLVPFFLNSLKESPTFLISLSFS